MAKVSAPLLSFTAHGKLANNLVFRRSKGQNIVSAYAPPATQPSQAQAAQQLKMKAARIAWRKAPQFVKALYRQKALADRTLSAYHIFIRDVLKAGCYGSATYNSGVYR